MKRITLFLVCITFVFGCAHRPIVDDMPVKTVTEQLRELDLSVSAFEKHPLASQQITEISLARTLIANVNAIMGTRSDDEVSLSLAAARGQVVKINTAIARIEAEMALESTRLQYEAASVSIKKMRDTNSSFLKTEQGK